MDIRAATARVVLPALGLSRAPHFSSRRDDWPAAFRDPADGPTPKPRPLLPYLQRLDETQPVVFHGSGHRAFPELKDERRLRYEVAQSVVRALWRGRRRSRPR